MAGVRRYQDLIVWRLSRELRREILALIKTGPVTRDFKFRDQIRDSASSGPRNIAEGFSRFNPAEFAHFLQIAKASLNETHNHLDDGFERGYFSDYDRERLQRVAGRAVKAAIRLIVYLQNCDGRKWKRRPRNLGNPPEPAGTPGTSGT